ncbi:MAG: pentapeptide repeat-containing protein [Pseudonocardiaceae bacterium]
MSARQRLLEPVRPLSRRAIGLGSVLLIVVGAVAFAALLYFYGGGTDRDRAKLDVVRTAGTLAAVPGGAIALFLAARRQRSTELTLEHQREVAVEQRITELYTRAVDQLGNGQAPVRLGGLHALERLAQNNPVQRQTIVDVICAYLRMPYALPDDKPPGEDAPAEAHTRYEQRRQELQVRLTAQRILAAHLWPDAVGTFWPDIDLDLTEAQLHRLDLANCHIRNAQFDGAQFSGDAGFNNAKFSRKAGFDGAQFSGSAWFNGAQFSRAAEFDGAQFSKYAGFHGAQFSMDAGFDGAQFSGSATFDKAQFSGDSGRDAGFIGARARPAKGIAHSWPATWTTREACEDEEDGWLYLVRVDE